MRHGTVPRFGSLLIACTLIAASAAGIAGCGRTKPKPLPVSRYTVLPPKTVPSYLKGTLLEQVDLTGTEPFVVNNYGLVSHLDNTGDSTASQAVRMFMLKEIARHGFGSSAIREFRDHDPEKVLKDPQNAIVQVDLYVPPGARKGQRTDVQVTALPESNTTSLVGGILFQTDLKVRGVQDLEGAVQVHAVAKGPVFVNPAYAAGTESTSTSEARTSKRRGVILDGGYIQEDRPLVLRVRTPSLRTARAIEGRIDQFFQETKIDQVAAAQDEGVVFLLTPRKFNGDWEHCAQLAMHLYFNTDPKFAALKADELAKEALKPDAALLDISYCWEGLGPAALPFILPLMNNEKPEIAFAAARAAAFLKDASAQTALEQIAKTPNNPFQLNAVQTLGALPTSPAINMKLRGLLDSDQTLVRIEAYHVLARHKDPYIYTRVINERIVLDIIRSKGPPLIYATRSGIPRIAVFGDKPSVNLPVTFLAMDNRFSITSPMDKDVVTLFYRDASQNESIKVVSRPDVAEIIARLGGEGPRTEARLDFGYADVVGIIQALADQKKLTAVGATPQDPVAFVLQENAALVDDIYNAPIIPDNSRPQVEENRPEGATEGTERNAEVGMQNAE